MRHLTYDISNVNYFFLLQPAHTLRYRLFSDDEGVYASDSGGNGVSHFALPALEASWAHEGRKKKSSMMSHGSD